LEYEVSIPCSQEPTTGPYPEPDESSSQPHTLIIYYPFQYYPHGARQGKAVSQPSLPQDFGKIKIEKGRRCMKY
jgi:hypothetical protein